MRDRKPSRLADTTFANPRVLLDPSTGLEYEYYTFEKGSRHNGITLLSPKALSLQKLDRTWPDTEVER
jgi:hypothetical protein